MAKSNYMWQLKEGFYFLAIYCKGSISVSSNHRKVRRPSPGAVSASRASGWWTVGQPMRLGTGIPSAKPSI